MSTIVIIGAGMMGSAMSVPASDNGHTVRVVGTHLDREIIVHARRTSRHLTMKRELPKSNRYYQLEELREALDGAYFVICGVSSFGVDWFLEQAVPSIPDRLPVLMVTKGLLDHPDGTLETFPHFLARKSSRPGLFSAVGGPCTSYELADRQHSAVAFCGEDAGALRMFRDALRTSYYHISLSSDVTGVETAVAMKNAYALAVSLAIGLHVKEFGEGGVLAYNPQAALFGQSVKEMRRMLRLTGGGDENILYAAGDLYVTVFGGRTRKLGVLLGRGLTISQALEELQGITLESVAIAGRTVRAIHALAERGLANIGDFPLLIHIGQLLEGGTTVNIPWQAFEGENLI